MLSSTIYLDLYTVIQPSNVCVVASTQGIGERKDKTWARCWEWICLSEYFWSFWAFVPTSNWINYKHDQVDNKLNFIKSPTLLESKFLAVHLCRMITCILRTGRHCLITWKPSKIFPTQKIEIRSKKQDDTKIQAINAPAVMYSLKSNRKFIVFHKNTVD